MTGFATLADLKQHLNITSSGNDSELVLMLDAAEDVVVSLTGDFAQATVTESVTPTAGTVILRGRSVSSVVVTDAHDVPVIGYWVDSAAGLIHNLSPRLNWLGLPLKVTYQTGTATVPAAVTLATVIIAGHLWETQRGTSPSQVLQGDTPEYQPGLGFAVPNRARELLAPYISTLPLIA